MERPGVQLILNGLSGSPAQRMLASGSSHLALRPFVGQDGRSYITQNSGQRDDKGQMVFNSIVTNAPALLRRDEWLIIDQAVKEAALPRLRAVKHVMDKGLGYNIPNAMGKTGIYKEKISDTTPASISMDGIARGDNDRVEIDSDIVPLPIIHKDFELTTRQIEETRSRGLPFDTTMIKQSTRKVAEEAEKLLIGKSTAYTFGGRAVYGYCNFPSRTQYDLSDPEDNAWTPKMTFDDVMAMKMLQHADYHYGPWVLYVGPKWDGKLDDDFSTAKGDITLRERILKISNIVEIVTLDYMDDWDMVLVELTSDTVEEMVGLTPTPVQWEEEGGMLIKFKVLAIMVPRLMADINGRCGIVHGTVPA